jgi:hypothetical protein
MGMFFKPPKKKITCVRVDWGGRCTGGTGLRDPGLIFKIQEYCFEPPKKSNVRSSDFFYEHKEEARAQQRTLGT